MSYLIPNDIDRLLQNVTLQQIISGNPLLTLQAEQTALTELKSYLSAKYNNDLEFTPVVPYNPASIYFATNRVYLDAPAYDATTYILNQLTLNAGLVYYCSVVITVPEAFTIGHWTLLGAQYDMFFASYPFPLFDLNGCYKVGDNVFWNGHTYTCKIPSQSTGQEESLQYRETYRLPYRNVFPDAVPCNAFGPLGSQYWTDHGVYAIPAGSLLVQSAAPVFTFFQTRIDLFIVGGVTAGFPADGTNRKYTDPINSLKGWGYSLERVASGTLTPGTEYTTDSNGNPTLLDAVVQPNEIFVLRFYPVVSETEPDPLPSGITIEQLILMFFTKGDNRNQQLVTICLDIMIYTLYRRIPPQVVPEIRIFAYQQAKQWLNNVAKGNEIVADIPKLQAPQGQRTRMGSNIKQQNSY